MKKRSLVALLMTVMMVSSLMAGCQSKTEDSDKAAETTEAAVEEKTGETAEEAAEETSERPLEGRTIQLAHNMADSTVDAVNAQFAAFEEKTGCKVEVEILAESADEAESILLTRAATGNLPDVFYTNVGAKLQEFSPADNILDISKEAFTDRMTDEFISSVSGDNGEIYSIPAKTVNVAGVFYNKPIYEELGLEIPETWDEFIANCAVIAEKTEVDPVAGAYATAAGRQILVLSQYYYVVQENPDFADQYTNREITLAESPAYMRGLEKLYQINELGYQNDDPLAMTFEDSAIALAEGSAAHTFCRTNIIGTIEGLAPDQVEDIGFFPLPDEDADKRGVALWLPAGWCINKNSENADAALALFEFLLSEEGLDAYCSAINPAGAFAVKDAVLPDSVATAIKEAQDWAGKASTLVMEYHCDIKGSNMSTILSMVGTGDLTPEEGVAELEADNAIDAQQKGIAGW